MQGQVEQSTPTYRGEVHMDQHAIREFKNQRDVAEFLSPLFRPEVDGKKHLEVYRTPGTFIHEYLVGTVDIDVLVKTLAALPAGISFECMDERMKHSQIEDAVVPSSHEGCGAGGVATNMMLADTEEAQGYRKRFAEVVGEEETAQLLEAARQAKASGDDAAFGKATDEIAKHWSMALTKRVADAHGTVKHEHLGVDDAHHHHTSLAVLDFSGNFMVPTPGEHGQRAFFISNAEHLLPAETPEAVQTRRENAYKSLAAYGSLAITIARGGHSSLPSGKPFTLAMVTDETFDEALWQKTWAEVVPNAAEDEKTRNYHIVHIQKSVFQQASR